MGTRPPQERQRASISSNISVIRAEWGLLFGKKKQNTGLFVSIGSFIGAEAPNPCDSSAIIMLAAGLIVVILLCELTIMPAAG